MKLNFLSNNAVNYTGQCFRLIKTSNESCLTIHLKSAYESHLFLNQTALVTLYVVSDSFKRISL